MENSDSFAILGINLSDKDKDELKTNDGNKKSPITTVIKIRKFLLNVFSLI